MEKFLVFLAFWTLQANASFVYYNFSGSIENYFSLTGGSNVKIGDHYNVVHKMDLDADIYSESLSSSSSIASYDNAILDHSFVINGKEVFSGKYRPTSVIQKVTVINNGHGFKTYDSLNIDLNGGRDNYSNDYGLMDDGNYLSSRLNITDLNAVGFSSYALPKNISLNEFEVGYLDIWSKKPSGETEWSIRASIDSFTINPSYRAVPEPSVIMLISIGLVGAPLFYRRNNKKRFRIGHDSSKN